MIFVATAVNCAPLYADDPPQLQRRGRQRGITSSDAVGSPGGEWPDNNSSGGADGGVAGD